MSLKLLVVSQVNCALPKGLSGDGKTEIKQSFISDPQTTSDPRLRPHITKPCELGQNTQSEVCLYLNISLVKKYAVSRYCSTLTFSQCQSVQLTCTFHSVQFQGFRDHKGC